MPLVPGPDQIDAKHAALAGGRGRRKREHVQEPATSMQRGNGCNTGAQHCTFLFLERVQPRQRSGQHVVRHDELMVPGRRRDHCGSRRGELVQDTRILGDQRLHGPVAPALAYRVSLSVTT